MNHQRLHWNVHSVANVGLRERLNLYKRGFKIYDLLVIYPLQKRAVRAVTNSEYRAHTAPLFTKLKILDIFQINTLDVAKFIFCYHNNLLPPLFLNLFMTNSQVHKYDTRTAGNCCVHPCRSNIKKFTMLYQGPRVWNVLPSSFTNLLRFLMFKNKVLEFLLIKNSF